MNFFTRLFGSKINLNNQAQGINAANAEVATAVIPENLFVESAAPESPNATAEPKTIVNDFLDQDFVHAGARDGFNFHSNEILESRKKEIKSRFSLVIDQAIQDKRQSRLQIENLRVEMAGISDEMEDKLANTIREMDHTLETLRQQKELTSMDEGWVMTCLRKYHSGFLQGMRDYIESESLFGSTKIL